MFLSLTRYETEERLNVGSVLEVRSAQTVPDHIRDLLDELSART